MVPESLSYLLLALKKSFGAAEISVFSPAEPAGVIPDHVSDVLIA